MPMVSERTRKTAFPLAFIAISILSAGIGFAAEGGGGHHVDNAVRMNDFFWRILNFVLLAGILWYAVKKADVKGSLAARHTEIEKSLKDAEAGRDAAEAKLREYSGKLDQASKEIDAMHASIIAEGEVEKSRIIAEAKVAAEKIIAQASLSAEQETVKARNELRAEAVRLAVEIATGKLTGTIQKSDHDRFVGEYLDKVVQIQ